MYSVKRSLFKNGIASVAGKSIRVLDQILLVPFFLSSWGAEYYGEWITLTIIPSVLSFSELGFGTAAANTFVLRYAAGDKQGAANIGKSGFTIISVMVMFGLLLSFLTLFSLSEFNVFDKLIIDKEEAMWAVFILMIARLLGFYHQFFEAYYRAARRAALSMNLLTTYRAIKIIAALAVLLSGNGIISLAIVDLAGSIVFLPVFGWLARRTLSLKKTYSGILLKEDIKHIVNKGLGFFLFPVWQAIYFQGTTFVVRLVLGPAAVAVFNTVRTVTRSVNQMFNIVNASIFPEIQFEIGAGNIKKARKILRMALGLVLFIALIGTLFLYFFGPWLYEIWTQKALSPPPLMWNIFIFGILFSAFWDTVAIVFRALNKPYELAIAGVVFSLVSVFISYFLSKTYGLTGAALGTIILDILMVFYVLPRSCKLMGQPLTSLFVAIYKDFLGMVNTKLKPGH